MRKTIFIYLHTSSGDWFASNYLKQYPKSNMYSIVVLTNDLARATTNIPNPNRQYEVTAKELLKCKEDITRAKVKVGAYSRKILKRD